MGLIASVLEIDIAEPQDGTEHREDVVLLLFGDTDYFHRLLE